MRLLEFKRFYQAHWWKLWLAVLVVPPVALTLGCLLWPEVFWDGYVYRYLWGPVVADAKGHRVDGIREGYTAVSTVTYAVVLAVAVMGIWRAFRHLGIRLDPMFLMAMVPWVVLGSELRALEDTGLFDADGGLVYLFISPLIYFLVGLAVVGLVVAAKWVELRSISRGPREALPWATALLVALNVPPAVAHALLPDQIEVHAPYLLLPALSAVGIAVLWWDSRRRTSLDMRVQVLVYGAVLVGLATFYVGRWAADPWVEPPPDSHPWELGVILGIAAACTAATVGLYWLLSRRWPDLRAMSSPVATLLFLSHFIDGAATYRGLDAYGYAEKHVLPSLLIDLAGTAVVMLLLKALVISAVVYLLDIAYREDLKESPTLGWLVKVAIMVLGLAPGIRDALRLAMGV